MILFLIRYGMLEMYRSVGEKQAEGIFLVSPEVLIALLALG